MVDRLQSPGLAPAAAARWLVVVLLAVIAACLLVEATSTPATAEASTGRSGNLLAVAGQVSEGVYGLYVIDLEQRTVCLYRYLGPTRKLQFVAARNFTYDLQLDDYNTAESPGKIKQIVDQQKRIDEVTPK